MASAPKVLKMPAFELAPEVREFLDRVVVPALVKKYFAEQFELKDPAKVVAVTACTSIICPPTDDRSAK
jgi:hypothetical protein